MIHIEVMCPDTTSGTWAYSLAEENLRQGALHNSSDAIGDYVTYKVYIPAGIYTVKLISWLGSDRGVGELRIDGTSVLICNLYHSGSSPNRCFTAHGVNVATSGVKTLTWIATDKHSSSSAYNIPIADLAFQQIWTKGSFPTASLHQWFCADNMTKTYADGDVLDGPIYWNDCTGNARDHRTFNATPTAEMNEQNGRPSVWFDNQDQTYQADTQTNSTTITCFVVHKTVAPTAKNWIWSNMSGDGVSRGIGLYADVSDGKIKVIIGEGTPVTCVGPSYDIANYRLFTLRHQTNLTELRINGADQTITNPTTNYLATQAGDFSWFGSGTDKTGLTCEVIVYSTALSDADRLQVETYLNDKYSLY